MELRWNSDIKHGIRNYCTWTWTTSWSLSSKKELQVLDSFGDLTFFYLDNLRSCQDEGRILWVGWWHRFSQQVACQVRWLLPFVSYHTKPNLSRISHHIASYRIISHHIASYRIIWHHTYFACLISMFPIQSVATFTYFYKLQTEQIYQHGAPLQVASRSPTRLRLVSSCGSSQMWIRMDQALPSQMYSHAGYMCTYYHYIIPST